MFVSSQESVLMLINLVMEQNLLKQKKMLVKKETSNVILQHTILKKMNNHVAN